MAVAPCIRQPLHQQHSDALCPSGTVRSLREGLTAAVGRQTALPGELHECGRAGEKRDPAGERHGALALAERLGREVESDQ